MIDGMAKAKVTWDTVRKIGLTLPEVEDSTAYGSPALKVRGTLLACIAVNKSAEPGTLAMRMDLDQRNALIAEAPDKYYLTDHYAPYPSVLVRLSRVGTEELRDLLGASWRYVTTRQQRAPAKRKTSRKRKPTSP
jgi:hypothetical protein